MGQVKKSVEKMAGVVSLTNSDVAVMRKEVKKRRAMSYNGRKAVLSGVQISKEKKEKRTISIMARSLFVVLDDVENVPV